MKLFKSIALLFVLSIGTATYAQSNATPDCKQLKHIKLSYVTAPNENSYVIIEENKHTEYVDNSKYFIKSDLNWINDCEYKATLVETTIPDFPLKPGVVMNVKFEKIENGIVSGKAIINGETFEVKFKIIK
ncbi:MAG TPA: hypothetical protein VJL37_06775 [Flavobacterium sp.]|nr:hypothetical protein [Flavobacterium sp.]